MLQQRKNLIKSELAKFGIKQVKVAEDLDIDPISVCNWIAGKFTSERINKYFGDMFGESFLNELKSIK